MKKVFILGCAWTQIPLLFDIIYESLSIREFDIMQNIPVEGEPGINGNFYRYVVHEPGEYIQLKGNHLTLGVTGPKAKLAVWSYFKANYDIEDQDIMNLIHPRSYVATSASPNRGLLAEPGVIISSRAKIGFGVTLKRGVSIGHDTEIGEYTEINPGAIIAGHAKIGRGCIIGVGSVIKNKITIGENTFIGMGSVVTGDIPPGVIAYGNPCKIIRENTLWKI